MLAARPMRSSRIARRRKRSISRHISSGMGCIRRLSRTNLFLTLVLAVVQPVVGTWSCADAAISVLLPAIFVGTLLFARGDRRVVLERK